MHGKMNGEKDKGFRAVLSDHRSEDSVPLQGKAFDLVSVYVLTIGHDHWLMTERTRSK